MYDYTTGVLITIILFLLVSMNHKQVILFYRPDCGHCQKMSGEWDNFAYRSNFTIFPRIYVKKININEPVNRELAENYEVTGVPHIVKIEGDGRRVVFAGDRSANELLKWCNN